VVDHVKIFRNHPGIRFTGRIHEQVLPAIRQLGLDVRWTDIRVRHSGSDQTPHGRACKHARDLRLLELELQEHPDCTFARFNLGMTLLDAGRAEDAVDQLCRSLQLASPGDSHLRKVYALLVQCYCELGRRQTALRSCLQGLELYPDDPELMFRRGVLLQTEGQLQQAEESFQSVLQDSQGRHFSSIDHGVLGIKAWHNLAIVRELQKKFEPAAAAWRKVLTFAGTNRQAWRGLIDSLVNAGDLGPLEELAERCGHASGCPDDLAEIARSHVASKRGDRTAALTRLEEAYEQHRSLDVLHELCRLSYEARRFELAEKYLEKLVQRCPDDPAAAQNLAVTYLAQRKFANAASSAQLALNLRKDSPLARQILQRAQDVLGQV
jgi:tetratricopeptide (TPR) repeat protein